MTSHANDVERLVAHVGSSLPADWPKWPGGWPGQSELALLDAVLSIRAQYGSPTTGVRPCVTQYKAHRGVEAADDLGALAGYSSDDLVKILGNRQKTSGRLKAEAAIDAARRLSDMGVVHAEQLDPDDERQRVAYCSVHGLGKVTWHYFCMLVGRPGTKADIWVRRFVRDAVGREVASTEAERLVRQVADELKVSPTDLDHAIWRTARKR
ncbi:hypothetical protein [uncultured Pseudokineococcus sp.]|uniref:hypothetical protein n=1 Tax=uncultured Pseudokineococcus sp. TaxID=1642928 RepID=UPI0026336096|nr:hypothetical protein [uncultured Pseudokineococcus sp.]